MSGEKNQSEAYQKMARFYTSEAAGRTRFSGQLTDGHQSLLADAFAGLTVDDCIFYHTMAFEDGQVFEGNWDLRGREKSYLGYLDLSGRTILELGPATGYLSFQMEKMGGRVTCFDIARGLSHELLPLSGIDRAAQEKNGRDFVVRTQNSWWYSHRKFKSRAKAVYGDIYRLPDDLGRFDISTLGCILLHLSNPFAALRQVAAVTEKAIVVTDVVHKTPFTLDTSCQEFNPGRQRQNPVNWWGLTPGAVLKMLEMLGFPFSSIYYHRHKIRLPGDPSGSLSEAKLYTIAAEREKDSIARLPLTAEEEKGQRDLEQDWVWDEVGVLNSRIRALHSSASWRITRPLRWAGGLLKRKK